MIGIVELYNMVVSLVRDLAGAVHTAHGEGPIQCVYCGAMLPDGELETLLAHNEQCPKSPLQRLSPRMRAAGTARLRRVLQTPEDRNAKL